MAINQLSVFAENKPGTIFSITKCIADAGVDIRAMSVADTQDFGILRLIVSDLDKAQEALHNDGCILSVTQVIGVEVPDVPGGLSSVLEILYKNGINVEYVYAFITISKKNACVVLRVGDNDKATEILESAGVKTLTEEYVQAI